ncbi:hypothetical protein BDB01DRAFT_775480 [Pilobolus umbonatus]|nr:hypothetical protein BDB01DRAFT_775480 [Pilobolus umbonatus]
MEGLEINSIPLQLLARILLQLTTVESDEPNGLIAIIAAGLQQYGQTDDLNAFLNYCQSLGTRESTKRVWQYYEIRNEDDWDKSKDRKEQEPIGLRFLLLSETARKYTQLTRYGKYSIREPSLVHHYKGQSIPIDQLLNNTLKYLRTETSTVDPTMERLINARLEQYTNDLASFENKTSNLDRYDYHLLGALMVRYDCTGNKATLPNSWCLYLRDYTESNDGSIWRVIYGQEEKRISCEQALADIRGMENGHSEFAMDYRPVYLFYGSQLMFVPKEDHITLEDYTFDDEYENEPTNHYNEEEEAICMHCAISDIVEDVNDIFICELCNRGVHQLCEDPPIQSFEKNIDPWYCRTCSRANNYPIPAPPSRSTLPSKRKRNENTVVLHNESMNAEYVSNNVVHDVEYDDNVIKK